MMDKIKLAVDTAMTLYSLGGSILAAVKAGDFDRVEDILPAEDRAHLDLLARREAARRDLRGE